MFTQILFTGLTSSSSYRWKIFFCMTEDTMFFVISEVLLIASGTLRQTVYQSLKRKSKSEFSDHFKMISFAHYEILKFITVMKLGTLLCHTVHQRWSTCTVERS